MYTKPILIGVYIATAYAAILTKTSTTFTDGTHFSDAIGCGKCLSLTSSYWVSSPSISKWATTSSTGTV